MIYKINYLFIVCYLAYACNGLRWTKSGLPVTEDTVISMMNVKSAPKIDVSKGVQITIIRNTKNFERGVYIYCFISGYNNNSKIEYAFCKENDCYTVSDGSSMAGISQYNFNIDFETKYPSQKGLGVKLNFIATSGDFSGNYYCKANNNNFAIRSNIIEIRDTIFWALNLYSNIDSLTKTNIKAITLNEMPQVLNCSDGKSVISISAPKWTKIEFFSPTQWSVCPVLKPENALTAKTQMSLNKCLQFSKDKCDETIDSDICPSLVQKMPDWSTYINQGGDLLFTGLPPLTTSRVGSYSLMCYTKTIDDTLKSIFYFFDTMDSNSEISKGITIDGSTKPILQPLTRISPEFQEFTLYARQIPKEMDAASVKPVAVYGLYKANPEAVYQWKMGTLLLNSNNIMTVSKYMVLFPGDITSDQAGTYTLQVTEKSEKITMVINVKVLGPPILLYDNCVPPLIYVSVGGGAAFTCNYKQRPTKVMLQINSQDISLSDTIENSKANLKKSNPYLEMLQFSTFPTTFVEADNVEISYNVFNLTKSQGHTQYQDHTVTFIASNDYGMSVKTGSIYVIPLLKHVVTYFPERDNCTNPCSSQQSHKFRCEVKLEEYANKELYIEYYWTINSNNLDEPIDKPTNIFSPYFRVNPNTKELTMLPIKSNNTDNDNLVKNELKSNFIECNVNIYPINRQESSFSYLSTTDLTLGNSMKARITLDYIPINAAYIYWIVAIILGLILLIIIIVLLVRYCMRNKGETYPLDKLERRYGYDPEKEVKEEMFKDYERQEHDPEMSPNVGENIISNPENSINSNDDEDLDNYELDPSNFNEDGSIIGKYGANPRSRAAMA